MAKLSNDVPEPLELDASWFHAFMSHSPMTAYVKDAEGRLLYVNPTFVRAFGFDGRDWYGKTDGELWDCETAAQMRANDAAILKEGRPQSIDETVLQADGEHDWLTVKFPFEDGKGRRYIAGIGVDVTGQRKMQEAIAQANRIESIGRLAGGIAHDFNNLLTVILGNCELTRLDLDEGEHEQCLAEIQDAAERAANLTQRLLGYARRQAVRPRTLATNVAVEALLPLTRRLLPENIRLEVSLGQATKIHIDPSQLEQVLVNLIVNARDAMAEGGCIEVTTGSTTRVVSRGGGRNRYAWIRVEDTGTGIPAEIIDQIFEPFYTTKLPGEGTGLGLSTCIGIIEQNDGFLELDSEPGRGTVFTVHLPQVHGPVSEPRRAAVPVRSGEGQVVLVAEDDDGVRRLIVSTLREHGYEVLATGSAEEALDRARQRADVALLISDMVMPGLNGVELQRRLRASHANVRTLFVSGYATGALASPSAPTDCPMLQKPFTPSALQAAVWAVLNDEEPAPPAR